MIADITPTSFKLDDELVDLESLRRQIMMLGHADFIHTGMNHLGCLSRGIYLVERDGEKDWNIEIMRNRLAALKQFLNQHPPKSF